MGATTKIEWTGATWNPVTGCKMKSPGCVNCYAQRMAGSRLRNHPSRKGLTRKNVSTGQHIWNGKVHYNMDWLEQPLQWKKPRKIFVAAHSDLFYSEVAQSFIDLVFAVMEAARWHTFQVLTKRPYRMAEYLARRNYFQPASDCLPHVWFGTSIEDQMRSHRLRPLLESVAGTTFLSCEPLIGPLDLQLDRYRRPPSWVIVGGESGPRARVMDPAWARSLRDQCKEADVPFFMKQMARGEAIPPDLMIREFPK